MSARWRHLVCSALVVGAVRAAAATPDGGTESNLALGAGSRGIALGGAFLAHVDDASAIYWNPAGLAALERGDLTLMHAPIGFGDAAQTFVGVAYPTLNAGSFGLGFMRLGTDGIHAYDAASRPLGDIAYSESSVYLAYAARPALPAVGRAVAVGATLKTLTQTLSPWSSTSAGLDLGLVASPPRWPNLGLAFVLQDAIGPRPRLDQEADPIPTTLHLAGSYRLFPRPGLGLELHLGLDHLRTVGWSPRGGLEGVYRGRLHLRIGASRAGAAFGLGVGWQQFGFDYAYLTRNDAATHPVSLGAAWGHTMQARADAHALARQAEVRAHLQAMLDERLAHAQAAYDRGDYAAALDEWRGIAGLDPADERVQRGIQAASTRLAELQSRSLADQSQAAARAARFELGLRYYGGGDYALARNVWQELLSQDPGNAEAARYLDKTQDAMQAQVRQLAEQARHAEATRDWVAALAGWTQVRLADPRHPEVEPGLARCRVALERQSAPRAARQGSPKAAIALANAADAEYREALALYANGDVTAAVAKLRAVRSEDPDNRPAMDLLAKAERQLRPLGDEERAHMRELYLRGMSFFTANEFDKAIDEWTKILVLDPGNTSVYQNIQEAKARASALHK